MDKLKLLIVALALIFTSLIWMSHENAHVAIFKVYGCEDVETNYFVNGNIGHTTANCDAEVFDDAQRDTADLEKQYPYLMFMSALLIMGSLAYLLA